MKFRIASLLLVLALILSLAPVASAQGGAPCYNLPQADCNVLLAAQANTEENLNSFQMQFMAELVLDNLSTLSAMFGGTSGASSAGPNQFVFHVEGDGLFAAEPGASPAEAMNTFAMTMDMDASAVMGTDEQSGPLSFVIVDGVYYQIEPPMDLSAMGITGVVGITLEQAMALAMEQGSMAGMSGLPGGAMTPESMADPSAMLEQLGVSEELMQALQNMPAAENIPGFISLERQADEDVLGQAMSPFTLSVDFSTLFASQEFQAVLQQAFAGAAESDPSAAQMGMMIPMLLSGVTLTADVTQWVGSDQFIHKLGVDVNGALDLAALMPPSSQSQNAPQIPPITFTLHFEVTLDQLNGTFDIAAPAGATILTDEQLQQLMQAAQ